MIKKMLFNALMMRLQYDDMHGFMACLSFTPYRSAPLVLLGDAHRISSAMISADSWSLWMKPAQICIP